MEGLIRSYVREGTLNRHAPRAGGSGSYERQLGVCVRAVVLSLARVLGLPVYEEEEDPCGQQRTGI